MSWQRAKDDAARVIDSMQIPRFARRGGVVDITEAVRKLKFEPKYRSMVIDAVKRILRSRGIVPVLKDEPGDE